VALRLSGGDGTTKDLVGSYSWLLVLENQELSMQASDWEQIRPLLKTVADQLDGSMRLQAEEMSRLRMATIAGVQMDEYAKQ
jgi:hypothetical protein